MFFIILFLFFFVSSFVDYTIYGVVENVPGILSLGEGFIVKQVSFKTSTIEKLF